MCYASCLLTSTDDAFLDICLENLEAAEQYRAAFQICNLLLFADSVAVQTQLFK